MGCMILSNLLLLCGCQVPGVEVVNFDKDTDVVKKLKEMTDTHGPDVGIEAGDNLQGYNLDALTVLRSSQDPAQAHFEECCSWMPLHQELDSPTGDRTATGDRLRRHDQ